MPVTEFAMFRLKEPYTLENEELRSGFRKVSAWQSEWSGYPLTYYKSVEDSAVLYLISGWKDVDAHNEWIKSEKNQILLKMFDPILTIADFVHLEIDFAGIPPHIQVLLYMYQEDNKDGKEKPTENVKLLEDQQKGEKPAIWWGQGRAIEKPREYFLAAFTETSCLAIEKGHVAAHWNVLQRVYFE